MKTVISILFLATTAFFSAQNVQVVKISEVKFNGKLKLFATKKEYLQIMGNLRLRKEISPAVAIMTK